MSSGYCLIDTSVWIEVLPSRRAAAALRARVDDLVAANTAATTGPVRLELLAGARNENEAAQLAAMFEGLHLLPVLESTWNEAARLGYALRRKGLVVPNFDLVIAAVAIANEATLLHQDKHFDLLAAHLPLKLA